MTTVLSDNFNSNSGGVPANWTQILDPGGSIVEKKNDLTITDTTGNTAGIASSKTIYNPEGVVSTIEVQINGVNASGNAICGLIGPTLPPPGSPPDVELGAGIDALGNVFVVAGVGGSPVILGTAVGYSGGKTTLTLKIQSGGLPSDGVSVTAAGYTGDKLFSDLGNFSLSAFKNVAYPALVGASQPNQKGGQARFGSITVTTE
jgi:hypothetical protein